MKLHQLAHTFKMAQNNVNNKWKFIYKLYYRSLLNILKGYLAGICLC